MLTHERELLSQLRHRSMWDRFSPVVDPHPRGQHGPDVAVVVPTVLKSTEAKAIFHAMKVFFTREGGSSLLAKSDLLRLVQSTSEDPTSLKKEVAQLGEPFVEDMGKEVVFQILAKFTILSQHEELLRAAKNGGPDYTMLDRNARALERLRQVGQEDHSGKPGRDAPRLLADYRPRKDEPGDRRPTYLNSQLDSSLGGGLRRKEAGLLVAPSNHGKTASLLRMATLSSQAGLKVFYASFEIYLEQIFERVKTIAKKVPKTLYAEEYDPESLTAEQVIQQAQKVKPDLLIVDYLNLLSLDKLDEVRAIGSAARKLRGYARREEIVVWTAAQADEPFESQMYLQRDQLYGSRQIIHAMDLVVGALFLPRRQVQTLHLWKTRHCRMGLTFSQQVDFVEMKVKEVNV